MAAVTGMEHAYERLAEIQARADNAIDALAPYVEDYRPREEAVEDILYRTAASDVPDLVAALEAVLRIDTGDNRAIYGNDFEAGMAKALHLVHKTIENRLRGLS